MSVPIKFSNYASTNITATVNAGDLTINVASTASFPSLTSGQYFYATIVDNASYIAKTTPPTKREIVKVTATTGTSMTVVRAFDGTSATAFANGDRIELRLNAKALVDLSNAEANIFQYGAAGDGATNDAAAFQAFFNDPNVSHCYIPAGTYKINTKVSIPVGVNKRLTGASMGATILSNSNTGIRLFEYLKTDNTTGTTSNVIFEQLTISGGAASTGTTSSVGVWWQGFDQSAGGHLCSLKMSDVTINGCLYGTYTKWASFCYFDRVYGQVNTFQHNLDRDSSFFYFNDCFGGLDSHWVYAVDTVSPNDGISNGLFFKNCAAVNCDLEEIIINGWQAVWLDQCSADGGSGGVASVYIQNCQEWHWHGGWIATGSAVAAKRGMWIVGGTGAGTQDGTIDSTSFVNGYINLQIDGVNTYGTSINVHNCRFHTINANTVQHIYLGNYATSCKITDNHIRNDVVALANPIACSGTGVNYNLVRHNTWNKAAGAWFPPANIGGNSLSETANNIFGAPN